MINALINFLKKLLGLETKKKYNKKQYPNTQQKSYNQQNKQISTPKQEKNYAKKKLLTPTELKFYNAIKKYVPTNYILQPQINLASIIYRTDEHKYQNELYRNIDFAIFDQNYLPIALIEINDKTHNEKNRKERDFKVKDICESAGIPLITFWTDYGVNEEYIQKRIQEYIV